jgi:polyphosphate kinase 2 (PPK2 family)
MSKNKDKDKASKIAETPEAKSDGKDYATELIRLQVELSYLQAWVKKSGARIAIIFEGRDAAG